MHAYNHLSTDERLLSVVHLSSGGGARLHELQSTLVHCHDAGFLRLHCLRLLRFNSIISGLLCPFVLHNARENTSRKMHAQREADILHAF